MLGYKKKVYIYKEITFGPLIPFLFFGEVQVAKWEDKKIIT